MRMRMGKGQVLVFDEYIEKQLEKLKTELGYYPTLREIGNQCIPVARADFVDRSLRRLAAAGRLSKEAMRVYNAKNNIKNITGDMKHDKRQKWTAKPDSANRHNKK